MNVHFPTNLNDYAPWVAEYGLLAPYGECQCGCGAIAPLAVQSHTATLMQRGQPRRFARYHQARLRDLLEPRFWAKVRKSDDCWEWTGCLNSAGYGQIRIDGKAVLAHRISFVIAYGPISDEIKVLHRCDNPPCVRPDHLFKGTLSDNTQDMLRKGRYPILRGEDNHNAKLSNTQANEIRELHKTGNYSTCRLAQMFGVSQFTTWEIVVGKRY